MTECAVLIMRCAAFHPAGRVKAGKANYPNLGLFTQRNITKQEVSLVRNVCV